MRRLHDTRQLPAAGQRPRNGRASPKQASERGDEQEHEGLREAASLLVEGIGIRSIPGQRLKGWPRSLFRRGRRGRRIPLQGVLKRQCRLQGPSLRGVDVIADPPLGNRFVRVAGGEVVIQPVPERRGPAGRTDKHNERDVNDREELEGPDVVAAVSVEKPIRQRPRAKQKQIETPEQPAIGVEEPGNASFQKSPRRSWLAVERLLATGAAEAPAYGRLAGRAPLPIGREAARLVERPANSRGRRRLDAFNTGRGIDRAGTANVHGGEEPEAQTREERAGGTSARSRPSTPRGSACTISDALETSVSRSYACPSGLSLQNRAKKVRPPLL